MILLQAWEDGILKKRIAGYIMALTLAAGLVLTVACGKEDVPPLSKMDESDSSVENTEAASEEVKDEEPASSEDAEAVEKEDEQPVETEEVRSVAGTDDECRTEIELLLGTEAVRPAETELLAEMARCVTFARILDEQGVMFSEMDVDRKAALRTQIFKEVMWGETAFSGAIPMEDGEGRFDADKVVSLEAVTSFFCDVYGEHNFTPAIYERVEDGYILLSYGDGDPWEIVEHMQFFEDENHYLLTGPAFYEDNGGTTAFKGYADILFAKNPDSRYGVTLLYGRYRDEKINVISVDTSSELQAANGKTYSGMNLIDGDYSTVWVEGVSGTGVGETITLHLDKIQLVYGVQICNGYTASYDLYNKNGTLTDVKIDFGNGKVMESSVGGYAFEDIADDYLAECNMNKVELDEPVMTDTITITITGAKQGVKYDDTCVSEVRVY